MPAIKRPPTALPRRRRQRGTAAVEFALLVIVFLTFVFAVIELARAMYLYNTLQEVTRRAASEAASTNFRDPAALDAIRYAAVLRSSAGELPLGTPVTDRHVRIDYLSLQRNADGSLSRQRIDPGNLPASPATNRQICHQNPYAATCIRFVQAQICNPAVAGACERVVFQMVLPLVSLPIPLPRASTTASAESLGYLPGQVPGS